MDYKNSFESEIRDAVSQINKKAVDSAPESNWFGVLGRSESVSGKSSFSLVSIKSHKLLSAAASLLLVALIGIPLAITLSNEGEKTVKTADKKRTTTTLPKIETTSSTAPTIPTDPAGETTIPTTGSKPASTTKQTTATNAPVIPIRPVSPSNPQFTGAQLSGPPGDPATYNVSFSWSPSPTPGIKYCAATNAEGYNLGVDYQCDWSNQYLSSSTNSTNGLVFKKNTTYQFQVLAIDQNNQKSVVASLNWQLP